MILVIFDAICSLVENLTDLYQKKIDRKDEYGRKFNFCHYITNINFIYKDQQMYDFLLFRSKLRGFFRSKMSEQQLLLIVQTLKKIRWNEYHFNTPKI